MSYTNKTQHYELPQWLGTDKPTWLGDMNTTMQTLDKTMYDINTLASNADGSIESIQNSITALNTSVSQLNSNLSNLTNKFNMTAENIFYEEKNGQISTVTLAKNNDASLIKIYGQYVRVANDGVGVPVNIPIPHGVITSNYVVNYGLMYYVINSTNNEILKISPSSLILSPGNLYLGEPSTNIENSYIIGILSPVLIFNKSFGDSSSVTRMVFNNGTI